MIFTGKQWVRGDSGVYVLTDGQQAYFGSAVDLHARRQQHWKALHKNRHHNHQVQELYDGGRVLQFKVLEVCPRDYVTFVEQTYLDAHFGKSYCMNLQPKAATYLPVQKKKKTVWNGVEYASRVEWANATGKSKSTYARLEKMERLSDEAIAEADFKRFNRRSIPFVWEGVEYISRNECSRITGIDVGTLRKCKNLGINTLEQYLEYKENVKIRRYQIVWNGKMYDSMTHAGIETGFGQRLTVYYRDGCRSDSDVAARHSKIKEAQFKKITWCGVEYRSIKHCAEAIGRSESYVRKWHKAPWQEVSKSPVKVANESPVKAASKSPVKAANESTLQLIDRFEQTFWHYDY